MRVTATHLGLAGMANWAQLHAAHLQHAATRTVKTTLAVTSVARRTLVEPVSVAAAAAELLTGDCLIPTGIYVQQQLLLQKQWLQRLDQAQVSVLLEGNHTGTWVVQTLYE
jgi:hypothetical protein